MSLISYTSSFVVKNTTSQYDVRVLGAKVKPGRTIDLFIAIPGLTEERVINAMKAPDGEMYKKIRSGLISVVSNTLNTLENDSSVIVAPTTAGGVLYVTKTINKDGIGADGAIVGDAVGSIGDPTYNGVTLVSGIPGSILVAVAAYFDYTYAGAAYTGSASTWIAHAGFVGGGVLAVLTAANSFASTSDKKLTVLSPPSSGSSGWDLMADVGKSLCLVNGNAAWENPGTAAGTLTVHLWYQVLPLS